jgi:hypothetical protein
MACLVLYARIAGGNYLKWLVLLGLRSMGFI